jgi:nickel-dependent lactate racemase
MSTFSFHYGHSFLSFTLPETFEIHQVLPSFVEPDKPEKEIVRQAIDQPLNALVLSEMVTPESTVAIVINDKTRPVPNSMLVPLLLEELFTSGVKQENIRFIIGVGTHTPMSEDEYPKLLPAEIIKKYSIISHNCDDEMGLNYKGITTRGTPVFVNREFDKADIRIVVGNIEPHHFAGFSGGVKSAAIGVCGRRTITTNHSLLLNKDATVGNFETNPLRQDIEEIGQLIHVDLALNVVMNTNKQILSCLFGKPEDVMREGMKVSRRVSMQELPHPVDLVIASAGGYPKDINLYQAQKAMTHASLILRPGGIILLAAACEEGIGSPEYEIFMQDVYSLDDSIAKFSEQVFSIGPHKAFQIARIAKDHPILLLSLLPPERVRQLLLTPVNSIEDGLFQANKMDNRIHSIAVLPYAVSTIPIISDQVYQ